MVQAGNRPPQPSILLRLHGLEPTDQCPSCEREVGDQLMRCECGRPYPMRCTQCEVYVDPLFGSGRYYDPPQECGLCEKAALSTMRWARFMEAIDEEDQQAVAEYRPGIMHQRKAAGAICDLCHTKGNRALVIHGSVGSGKTWTVLAEFAKLVGRLKFPLVWIRMHELVSAAKAGALNEEGQSFINRAIVAGTLVIDEFGSRGERSFTPHVVDVVNGVLMRRFSGRGVDHATVLISNRPPAWGRYVKRAERIWDDAVASRFEAVGRVVEMVGDDMRGSR